VDVRRIGDGWYGIIVALVPAATVAAIVVAAMRGSPVPPVDLQAARDLAARPARLLGFAAFILVFGPVPEELGWRGYALDRLQERWSPLSAALALGAAWGAWHIPLFVLKGYFGETSPPPVPFMLDILLTSVLIAWIYNHTRASVLAAILFHFMVNLTGELLVPSRQVRLYRTGLIGILVMGLILWRGSALRSRPGNGSPETSAREPCGR
jgi:membrane protease YdiL (CAAX protease family)